MASSSVVDWAWCIFYGHDVIAENWLTRFISGTEACPFTAITGVLVAAWIFARVKRKRFPDVSDFLDPCPASVCWPRLGNFITASSGQADGPAWGFGVPNADGVLIARHPRSS